VLTDAQETVRFRTYVSLHPGEYETADEASEGGVAVRSTVEPAHVGTLRALARDGRLAETVASASPTMRVALSGATFTIAWPVVFARLTKGLELRRGHFGCAGSMFHMEQDCLDRFYDDVEAVIDDVLAHAEAPIRDLEAWIAARIPASTVDAHRRRRGDRGALQRPRLPQWLGALLDRDPWLCDLAIQILIWAGIDATAGVEVWPLDGWAVRRRGLAGDAADSDAAAVAADIETVLTAMRSKAGWYEKYVERPMGYKQAPVVAAAATSTAELPPLLFTERADVDDTHLAALAAAALREIESGLSGGAAARTVVADVIRTTFAGGTGGDDLDLPPLRAPDHDVRVDAVLNDPASVDRIVAEVLTILG
jgi:hypothetical protein